MKYRGFVIGYLLLHLRHFNYPLQFAAVCLCRILVDQFDDLLQSLTHFG